MQRNRSFETHSGWGAAVALAAVVAGLGPWSAFLVAFAAGVLVELVQWAVPVTGNPSAEDVLYTGVGAVAGAAWALVWGLV
jgi:uncharacterized membrane protein YjjP (DUF1212 family)